ncbi:hypothetical protein MtrunA17_Chr6g0482241 [Medicago truncatula]|uniref:Transmembrane protein n=1 Tax=Medicago truncatula TaxID=3880 RepID=A0A396HL29_MEDTR|nr:hypothetical protein MtrunA17_Chr6g0482241 [Medicago truncatula]
MGNLQVILSSRWWLTVSRALIRGMGFYCFLSFLCIKFWIMLL